MNAIQYGRQRQMPKVIFPSVPLGDDVCPIAGKQKEIKVPSPRIPSV